MTRILNEKVPFLSQKEIMLRHYGIWKKNRLQIR
ncbi:hypothetical protein KPNJ1_01950 [Klebsiella pneumoniae 30660/NJST258_1]|uniref:Uncharacterized protein n=1 Tax=Klebsiella pneumoniae 30684/NJST258_2 TaxID=1420013 RepID=W8UXR3_KLEPN|nr:hypothetical protein KPNJ2_01912 [Klebsiella pneumoniae 30684/NJST258_2]AHM84356.1 hypothetical protein KPNJ1_01950 [Klebsiella pneumoniae 30660/NJST258_1]